jgi:type I restriction enzyme S subunit
VGGGYREDGLKYYSGRYKSEQVVYQNDVVMAVTDMTQDRAVIGRVARMPELGEKGAVISLDTVKLVPKDIHKTFLYAYMRHSGFANFIKEFANGANVLHLKPDLITQQKIIIPPIQLQNKFVPIAEPLYAEADLLGKANTQLVKMRDMLLPRLISGKLSVEHLDIQFPPGMEDRP